MIGNNKGFTLLELAIVLFIISLILGGVLSPLSTRVNVEERKKTAAQLEDIRSSLVGYAVVNGHLPCPDCPDSSTGSCGAVQAAYGSGVINDGSEDGMNGGAPAGSRPFDACATQEGNLPWVSLGVDGADAWEQHFSYRVTEDFADDTDGTSCGTPTIGISFELCSTGNIDIDDEAGNSVAQDVPALVISYGNNADEPGNPSSSSESENQDGDTTFVQRDFSTGSTSDEFDDLLIWVPTSTLIYRMIQAERLP